MQLWRMIQLIIIIGQSLATMLWLIPYPVLFWMCIYEATRDRLVNTSVTP